MRKSRICSMLSHRHYSSYHTKLVRFIFNLIPSSSRLFNYHLKYMGIQHNSLKMEVLEHFHPILIDHLERENSPCLLPCYRLEHQHRRHCLRHHRAAHQHRLQSHLKTGTRWAGLAQLPLPPPVVNAQRQRWQTTQPSKQLDLKPSRDPPRFLQLPDPDHRTKI